MLNGKNIVFNADNIPSKGFVVQITTWDGTKSIDGNKPSVYINGNKLSLKSIDSNIEIGENSGFRIGGEHTNGQYKGYNGNLGDIIYFDEVLGQEQISAITYQLQKKYGLITACKMQDMTGYIFNCDTSDESKTLMNVSIKGQS